MAQKRTPYVNTSNGKEKQLVASHASITELDPIEGMQADNVQDAIEELKDKAERGGVTGVKGNAETEYRGGDVNITPTNIGLGNVTNDAQVKRSEMGVGGGVATLDDNGKVPSSQLPSYVDDVIEGTLTNETTFTPSNSADSVHLKQTGKIYVDVSTNKSYRWGGSKYTEISASLALGETPSTAYPGDKGAAAAAAAADAKQSAEQAKSGVNALKEGTDKAKVAESADKFSSARKITLSGDATGEVSFDGSADKTLPITLSNTGVAAGTYSAVTVDEKGRVTAGGQLVEWGVKGQKEPSTNLAIGGIFFELVE